LGTGAAARGEQRGEGGLGAAAREGAAGARAEAGEVGHPPHHLPLDGGGGGRHLGDRHALVEGADERLGPHRGRQRRRDLVAEVHRMAEPVRVGDHVAGEPVEHVRQRAPGTRQRLGEAPGEVGGRVGAAHRPLARGGRGEVRGGEIDEGVRGRRRRIGGDRGEDGRGHIVLGPAVIGGGVIVNVLHVRKVGPAANPLAANFGGAGSSARVSSPNRTPVTRPPRLRPRAAVRAARRALPLAALVLAAVPAAHAQAPAAAAPTRLATPTAIRTERYQLPNGLTVILAPDRSSQVVAVDMWYDVGSRNERPGRTGFAHLFEHMMFQGSANVRKGEHLNLVQRAGGSVNGTTRTDITNYYQTLPSNQLALGLWLEADRMRSLAVTKANLDNQREAVKEERRLRVDNQPYAGAFQEALTSPYDSARCFGYAHTTIGSMADLNAATEGDVRQFFTTYYAPNNATLVVTGDFDPAQARQLVTQYYGNIPRVQAPAPVACEQPFSPGAQRRSVTDAKATLPAVLVLWRTPAYRDADVPALTFLGSILGQGESSRLNVSVVREARAAVNTQALVNPLGPTRGPGLFAVVGIANQGVRPTRSSGCSPRRWPAVAAQGVTEAELSKAKNGYLADRIDGLQRNLARAEAIHTANTFFGDPNAVNTDLQRFSAVTAADVQRVARTYLVPANSVTVLIAPPEAPKP
jgi:predicted Zn-dependent peptidase